MSLLTDAMAAARLTRLLVDDRITARARQWWWEHYGYPPSGGLSYLLACPACAGLWVAFIAELPRRPRSLRHALAVGLLVPPLVGIARSLEQNR